MDGWRVANPFAQWISAIFIIMCGGVASAQNYERYQPLDPTNRNPALPNRVPEIPDVPEDEEIAGDDRVLVDRLDAVVIVDSDDKISTDPSVDDLEGLHHDFAARDSLVFRKGFQNIIHRYIGQPITLRRINQLSAEIIKHYRQCKQPIVDVRIPEQRITGGTLHLVIIETRVGSVRLQHGPFFGCQELSRWIECTRSGARVYEPYLESDLLWLNQNPFRRVTVDFEKGGADGTTDVVYRSHEVAPMRGYIGADDTGVDTLNYGRFFAGFTYGNLWNRGGILGYQYTTDEDFRLLHAHSLSYLQPLNRKWSLQSYGSWAGVTPELQAGLSQSGESWQVGASMVRHLTRSRQGQSNFSAGFDFKSTDNNLEFSGSTISNSNAELLQLRFEYDQTAFGRSPDEFSLFRLATFIGPGGIAGGAHSTAAFNTIRPGTSPDYIYMRLRLERSSLIASGWQLQSRFAGQVASERLLFSEMLGFGGFDSLRGFDQRAYNADHGWIANFEFGPRTRRGGSPSNPTMFRYYTFIDLGDGYLEAPLPGEDAHTFAMSAGIGARYQVSDKLIARFDYGAGVVGIADNVQDHRIHFGLTWIPGPRP